MSTVSSSMSLGSLWIRFEILSNVHDHITSAHFGLTKLLVNLSKDIGGKVCLKM